MPGGMGISLSSICLVWSSALPMAPPGAVLAMTCITLARSWRSIFDGPISVFDVATALNGIILLWMLGTRIL